MDTEARNNEDVDGREGVEPTYKGVEGVQPFQITWGRFVGAPLLRGGPKHSNEGKTAIEAIRHLTRKIRKALGVEIPIIVRMDADFCDRKIYKVCEEPGIGYLSSGRVLEERSCRSEERTPSVDPRASGPSTKTPLPKTTSAAVESGREGVVEPDTILPEIEYPLDPKEAVRAARHLHPDADRRRRAGHGNGRGARCADSLKERLTAHRNDVATRVESIPEDLASLLNSAEAHADELQKVRGDTYDLAQVFNWSFVTQPSLHPSTPTHRRRFRALTERLREATQAFEAVAAKARSQVQ